MTTPPILALRAAIRSACLADATLAGLMGGSAALVDEPEPGALPLYATFGDCKAEDASAAEAPAHRHEVAIVVWARPGSAASALAVAGRMAELLDDAALALDGHRLVSLAAASVAQDRDDETNLARATLRLAAYTEPTA